MHVLKVLAGGRPPKTPPLLGGLHPPKTPWPPKGGFPLPCGVSAAGELGEDLDDGCVVKDQVDGHAAAGRRAVHKKGRRGEDRT